MFQTNQQSIIVMTWRMPKFMERRQKVIPVIAGQTVAEYTPHLPSAVDPDMVETPMVIGILMDSVTDINRDIIVVSEPD